MKDESKAQWPERMRYLSPTLIVIDGGDDTVVELASEDLGSKNSDVAEQINRYRYAQINALPEMVALLKQVSVGRGVTPGEARDLLREIGELE